MLIHLPYPTSPRAALKPYSFFYPTVRAVVSYMEINSAVRLYRSLLHHLTEIDACFLLHAALYETGES